MPDLRSLEERIAELVREELEHDRVKVCCQDFEHCTKPCTPRADHWEAEAEKAFDDAKYWKAAYISAISVNGPSPAVEPDTPWPHAPSGPLPSQKAPSSQLSFWQLQELPWILLGVVISLLAATAVIAWVHLCR